MTKSKLNFKLCPRYEAQECENDVLCSNKNPKACCFHCEKKGSCGMACKTTDIPSPWVTKWRKEVMGTAKKRKK